MVLSRWSKPIYFSMVADSRFTDNINTEIEKLHTGILTVLKDKTRFNLVFEKSKLLKWSNENTTQLRVYYKVEVNKAITGLNELYSRVNSVKPVYYGNKWRD